MSGNERTRRCLYRKRGRRQIVLAGACFLHGHSTRRIMNRILSLARRRLLPGSATLASTLFLSGAAVGAQHWDNARWQGAWGAAPASATRNALLPERHQSRHQRQPAAGHQQRQPAGRPQRPGTVRSRRARHQRRAPPGAAGRHRRHRQQLGCQSGNRLRARHARPGAAVTPAAGPRQRRPPAPGRPRLRSDGQRGAARILPRSTPPRIP